MSEKIAHLEERVKAGELRAVPEQGQG